MAIEIQQIALLVHPDYHLHDGFPLDQDHKEMRERWDRRTEEISMHPNQAMFYYSALWFGDVKSLNSEAEQAERERQIIYGQLLGPRFFYFYNPCRPENITIGRLLIERDMLLTKNRLEVEAFGEYQEICVDIWGREFRNALSLLGIQGIRLQINPILCVRSVGFQSL